MEFDACGKGRQSKSFLAPRQAVDQATRWRRVQANWREVHRTLPLAFEYLKKILSVEEYERTVKECETGYREVR
jgi:hypothetical protein